MSLDAVVLGLLNVGPRKSADSLRTNSSRASLTRQSLESRTGGRSVCPTLGRPSSHWRAASDGIRPVDARTDHRLSHANPYTTTDKILLIAVVARGNWPNTQARDAAQTAVSDRHRGGLRQMRTANLLTAPPSQSAYGWCDSGRTSMADADGHRRRAMCNVLAFANPGRPRCHLHRRLVMAALGKPANPGQHRRPAAATRMTRSARTTRSRRGDG
jgi:hypothetical protein